MRTGGADVAIAALADVRKTIDRLAQLPRKLAQASVGDVNLALRSQFQRGVDSYDRPWRPLKPSTIARGRRNPPLTDRTKLRDGTMARATQYGLQIAVGARYGAFHQVGFRVGRTWVGPRKILPGRGLPKAWRLIFERRARELARVR